MRAALSFVGGSAPMMIAMPQRPGGGPHLAASTAASRLLPVPPCKLLQQRPRLQAAAGDPSEPAGEPAAAPAASGSNADLPPRAVSLPMGLPTAGAVFFAAGALKILIMCFPYSEMAVMMYLKGHADLGLVPALKAIPLALALAALAKAIIDRQLQNKRWVKVAVVVGGVVALFFSRFIFARPRPSPLDPMFRHMAQERAVMAAEQQRMGAAQRQHLLRQPDPEVGRALQQQQAARGR